MVCKKLDTTNAHFILAEMKTNERGENDRLDELQRSKVKMDWTLRQTEAVVRKLEAELTALMHDDRHKRLTKVDHLTNATRMQLTDAFTAVIDWTDRRKRMAEVYEELKVTNDAIMCDAQTMFKEFQREYDRLTDWISVASDWLMNAEYEKKNLLADMRTAIDRLNITKAEMKKLEK